MRKSILFFFSILTGICLVVASERRAWGYVDPGSGLIALQGIASVAAAYAYYIRRRIRTFFSRKNEQPPVVLPVTSKPGEPSELA